MFRYRSVSFHRRPMNFSLRKRFDRNDDAQQRLDPRKNFPTHEGKSTRVRQTSYHAPRTSDIDFTSNTTSRTIFSIYIR